jgi:2-polyprenyl-6-methoxyphenol hydroxylase-like FAD-dependent oxidoreductase
MGSSDVLIVGGGIGGLATAIALRATGRNATVLEISADMQHSVLGVGIIQPINALRALDAIGCADACLEQGYASDGWARMLDLDGNPLREIAGAAIPGSTLPTFNGITRPKLHKILTDRALDVGVVIEYGTTITDLAQDAAGVTATLSTGGTCRVDIVIGADGVRSIVRPYVMDLQPTYLGQSAFRVDHPRHPEIDRIILQAGPSGMAGYVPIGPELAYLFLNVTFDQSNGFLTQDEAFQMLLTLLEPYGGLTAEIREKHLHDPASVVFRGEEYLIAPAPWHNGRIVLIGDAVHTVPPHLGQGAAQAIEDGIVLADELDRQASVDDALNAYVARRYERCRLIVETCVAIADNEMHRTPGFDHAAITQHVMDVMVQPL